MFLYLYSCIVNLLFLLLSSPSLVTVRTCVPLSVYLYRVSVVLLLSSPSLSVVRRCVPLSVWLFSIPTVSFFLFFCHCPSTWPPVVRKQVSQTLYQVWANQRVLTGQDVILPHYNSTKRKARQDVWVEYSAGRLMRSPVVLPKATWIVSSRLFGGREQFYSGWIWGKGTAPV